MAYTTIDDPTIYFNTKLYNGTGSNQSITGVGFQPDFIWGKTRSSAQRHVLTDVVRGINKQLASDSTAADTSYTNSFTAFGSDGFSVGTDNGTNMASQTQVAWNWKANGSGSLNEVGSIDSTVSVNTTTGFSIVSYTGTGSAATVGHGMGATPTMMIIKNRDDTDSWYVWHQGLGAVATNYITLDTNGAKSSVSDGITALSSTTFSLGNRGDVNASSEKYIAYCFAEKQGYSKFGSYVGNGNADGTFIYTGQKSAFIMLKNTTRAASWLMYDNKRLGYNVDNNEVVANTTAVEETYDQIDILSNGFKMRANGTSTNLSGDTYIYMAFAEEPFVASNFNTATAR